MFITTKTIVSFQISSEMAKLKEFEIANDLKQWHFDGSTGDLVSYSKTEALWVSVSNGAAVEHGGMDKRRD